MPGFGHLGRRSFLAAAPSDVDTEGMDALAREHAGLRVGWISYDLGREIEAMPERARDDLDLPALALGRHAAWLEFDHRRREVHVRGEAEAGGHLVRALERAPREQPPAHRPLRSWSSSLPRPEFERAARRAIEYVHAGDAFQVNLAQRLSAHWSGDPFALYARLRNASPAPFMALARLGGADVVSASPERFVRRRGRSLETRPIKGTRPRGRTAAEDRRQAAALRGSAKDRAENVMIADLARNDVGRVARYGSVSVRRLCALERHPGLHHLVSVVEGEVDPELTPAEIVRATFPPGSVTGAPKIRAMEIIEELEPVRRGVYCGSVGWLGRRDLDLSVAIRTFVSTRGRLHLHVGGAIVADSDPVLEWQETMHKAARLLEAAGGALRRPADPRPRPRAAHSRAGAVAR
jgi:para-aminobenzoate synthetase component 1